MRVQKSIAVVGAGALVLIGTGSAVAANGHDLILGHKNSATKVTTLSNSKGTPLSLKAKRGHAPLAVNSTKVVKDLNSDLLDGVSGGSFQRKITGPCTSGKAATAVASNSLTCAAVAAPVSHVITLSAGTSATANGAELRGVLAAITDATAADGYLVKLGPGAFDEGSTSLTVPSHVDLVGAGENRTTITSSADGGGTDADPTGAVVDLSANSALSDVAVTDTNTASGVFQIGVLSSDTGSTATVSDVAVFVPAGFGSSGVAAGNGSTLVVRGLTATIVGSFFAEGGRADATSTLTVTDSTLLSSGSGANFSVGTNSHSTVQVIDSQMPSGAEFTDNSTGATVTCFGDYTAALVAVPPTC